MMARFEFSCSNSHSSTSASGRQQEVPDPVVAPRISGTVKWFNVRRGYGFIKPDYEAGDIFVHRSAIVNHPRNRQRSVGDGERVEFHVVKDGSRRLMAANVTGPGGSQVIGSPYAVEWKPPNRHRYTHHYQCDRQPRPGRQTSHVDPTHQLAERAEITRGQPTHPGLNDPQSQTQSRSRENATAGTITASWEDCIRYAARPNAYYD
ncbi:hypothetical protein EGW08_023386 [Elysia chlorotica]|uniref:CSD domain-containing protein n=1 Tax=Elysia chlorotica TaxID=188477 RepID=A0A3S1AW37_ELYCH|nr:hypothetical protein EGW08_023386 [Elysia chlorotica]